LVNHMSEIFVPCILENNFPWLYEVDFQRPAGYMENDNEDEDVDKSYDWEDILPVGDEPNGKKSVRNEKNGIGSRKIFDSIYEKIKIYFIRTYKNACPYEPQLRPLKENIPKESRSFTISDYTVSILLGVFLAAAQEIDKLKVKDRWQSITATGTFIPTQEPEDNLMLEVIEKPGEKFKAFEEYVEKHKDKSGEKRHLFLYVSDKTDWEKDLVDKDNKNICVKSFSPATNTLFDILDYVFDLPPFLPEGLLDENEQKKLFLDFTEKTKHLWREKRIETPFYHTNEHSGILENNSLFIHGPYGSGKSYLAMQLVRRLVWDGKIYAPIWLNIDNDRLTDAGIETKSLESIYSSEKLCLPPEIRSELVSFFDNVHDEKSLLEKLSKNRYLIIIDGLDLPDQLLDYYILRMEVFFTAMRQYGNSIIITSTRNHEQPNVNNLVSVSMPAFAEEAITEYFYAISSNKKNYIENKQQIEKDVRTYSKELTDLEYLGNFVYKNYGNNPHLIEVISDQLFLYNVDYKNFILPDDTAKCYMNLFNNMDPHNKYTEDAQWVLLYLLNYSPNKFVPLKKLQSDIDVIIDKEKDKDAIKKLKDIFDSNLKRLSVLSILIGSKLILKKEDSVKIFDTLTYKTLLHEDYFSLKDKGNLRKRLVSEKRMLNEIIFDYLVYKKEASIKKELEANNKELFEAKLVLFKKGLYDKEITSECNILHGLARWCPYIEIFEILLEMCPELLYTDKNGKRKPAVDKRGRTILHYAVASNPNYEIIEFLLKRADRYGIKDYLSYVSENGNNVLHYTAEFNPNPQIARSLLNHNKMTKDIIDHQNSEGLTLLHYAVMAGNFDIVMQLKALGANLNLSDKLKFTPLHLAVEIGKPLEFIDLLATLKNINEKTNKDFYKSTPLLLAVNLSSHAENKKKVMKETVRYLINHKADIEIADDRGNTPLHYAVALSNDSAIVEMLITRNTINKVNNDEFSPLALARKFNASGEIKTLLINRGAKF